MKNRALSLLHWRRPPKAQSIQVGNDTQITGHKLQPLQVIAPGRLANLASAEQSFHIQDFTLLLPSQICLFIPSLQSHQQGPTSPDMRGQKCGSLLHAPCPVNGEKPAPPQGEQSPLPHVMAQQQVLLQAGEMEMGMQINKDFMFLRSEGSN